MIRTMQILACCSAICLLIPYQLFASGVENSKAEEKGFYRPADKFPKNVVGIKVVGSFVAERYGESLWLRADESAGEKDNRRTFHMPPGTPLNAGDKIEISKDSPLIVLRRGLPGCYDVKLESGFATDATPAPQKQSGSSPTPETKAERASALGAPRTPEASIPSPTQKVQLSRFEGGPQSLLRVPLDAALTERELLRLDQRDVQQQILPKLLLGSWSLDLTDRWHSEREKWRKTFHSLSPQLQATTRAFDNAIAALLNVDITFHADGIYSLSDRKSGKEIARAAYHTMEHGLGVEFLGDPRHHAPKDSKSEDSKTSVQILDENRMVFKLPRSVTDCFGNKPANRTWLDDLSLVAHRKGTLKYVKFPSLPETDSDVQLFFTQGGYADEANWNSSAFFELKAMPNIFWRVRIETTNGESSITWIEKAVTGGDADKSLRLVRTATTVAECAQYLDINLIVGDAPGRSGEALKLFSAALEKFREWTKKAKQLKPEPFTKRITGVEENAKDYTVFKWEEPSKARLFGVIDGRNVFFLDEEDCEAVALLVAVQDQLYKAVSDDVLAEISKRDAAKQLIEDNFN